MGGALSCCSEPASNRKTRKSTKKPLIPKKAMPKREKKLNKPVVMCGNLEKQTVKESTFEELCDMLDEEVDEKNMSEKEIAKTKRRLSQMAEKRQSRTSIVARRESQLGANIENMLQQRDTGRRTSRLSINSAPILPPRENSDSEAPNNDNLNALFGKIHKKRAKKGL
ncbi:Oidioi.mRNA.OKI2018_I69.chr2.g8200.t1.cds [Oikopleura dioica]|uniref:Oidioi.mRNA.OKI2018_I69.chr2.g8200.t1.cds n=1 Tax=Oikopleura dioica TaxID=34765 RepID=A0ABN7TD59_OIKDI|nr:Oidioi.mRNA.OKI2018_I69.chr2.g8200.t1.cds [Oikopleura dioica]